jgi:hypothetical protein
LKRKKKEKKKKLSFPSVFPAWSVCMYDEKGRCSLRMVSNRKEREKTVQMKRTEESHASLRSYAQH